MEKLKVKRNKNRFQGTLGIVLVFILIALVLLVELTGVQFQYTEKKLDLLPEDKIVTKEEACQQLTKDILLLYSSADEISAQARNPSFISDKMTSNWS